MITRQFEPSMEKLRELWGTEPPSETLEDFFSVQVELPNGTHRLAKTHVFGKGIQIVPYHDLDTGVTDCEGRSYPRGDMELSQLVLPGEFAYMMRHHRPTMMRTEKPQKQGENSIYDGRLLKRPQTPTQMRAHLKLQDTHVGVIVGVANRDGSGHPGVVTLHNPQCYPTGKDRVDEERIQDDSRRRFGRFGDENEEAYSMILFKPRFPSSLVGQADLIQQYNDNTRTMLVGFNAVADYPFEDFDGGDPLAAHDVESVMTHCSQMVRAIAGEEEAIAWFKQPENLIYCSEFAHLSTSAGLHCPLNAMTLVPMVGSKNWKRFADAVEGHNQGEMTRFRSLNKNHRVQDIKLTLAEANLGPLSEYVDEPLKQRAQTRLAFPALTAEGIAKFAFAELGLPGHDFEVLQWLCPGFNFDSRDLDDGNIYEELLFARPLPGQRPADSLFVPPTLFHLAAKGHIKGGLLDLEYVGHGLHFSLVRPVMRTD